MTVTIIILSAAFSVLAFSKRELMHKFQFNAYQIFHRKEIHRIITHAFLHADLPHLAVNMLVLYFFGRSVESYLDIYFQYNPIIYFILLYLGGIIFSTLYALVKHKDNVNYNAVGASGAVSAVVFASIFFDPLGKIYIYAALPVPGILFGGLYLAYSFYMSRKKTDNVAHDAHFWGAVYGFVFPILIRPELFTNLFLEQILG